MNINSHFLTFNVVEEQMLNLGVKVVHYSVVKDEAVKGRNVVVAFVTLHKPRAAL